MERGERKEGERGGREIKGGRKEGVSGKVRREKTKRRREKWKVWKGKENYISLASCQKVCLDLCSTHVCTH